MDLVMITPALRLILGITFSLAGLLKLKDLKGFRVAVASYGLIPVNLLKPLSTLLPLIELLVGLLILSGILLKWAALVSILMLLQASGFLVYALVERKRMENCGCMGAVVVPLRWTALIENGFLISLAFVLLYFVW